MRVKYRWSFMTAVVLLALVAWEIAGAQGTVSRLFFPQPSEILRSLSTMSASGEMGLHLTATLRRALIGLAAGGSLGLVLGLAMGKSQPLRRALNPVVAAAHPLPKIALLPLIMIFFGIGEMSKIIIVAVVSFFPLLINSMEGVRQISPKHFEVARNYGVSRLKTVWLVLVPGSLPFALAGLRLAANSALVLAIAVEIVTAQIGLGEVIWESWQTLRTERLYASLVVITLLGISLNAAIGLLDRLLVPWQDDSGPLSA